MKELDKDQFDLLAAPLKKMAFNNLFAHSVVERHVFRETGRQGFEAVQNSQV